MKRETGPINQRRRRKESRWIIWLIALRSLAQWNVPKRERVRKPQCQQQKGKLRRIFETETIGRQSGHKLFNSTFFAKYFFLPRPTSLAAHFGAHTQKRSQIKHTETRIYSSFLSLLHHRNNRMRWLESMIGRERREKRHENYYEIKWI